MELFEGTFNQKYNDTQFFMFSMRECDMFAPKFTTLGYLYDWETIERGTTVEYKYVHLIKVLDGATVKKIFNTYQTNDYYVIQTWKYDDFLEKYRKYIEHAETLKQLSYSKYSKSLLPIQIPL